MKEDRDIVLRMGDFHVPFHDTKAVDVAIKFAECLEPKVVVLDELIDMYSVSKYSKDPQRKNELQRDLNTTKKLLGRIRNAVPKADLIMVRSNHAQQKMLSMLMALLIGNKVLL